MKLSKTKSPKFVASLLLTEKEEKLQQNRLQLAAYVGGRSRVISSILDEMGSSKMMCGMMR